VRYLLPLLCALGVSCGRDESIKDAATRVDAGSSGLHWAPPDSSPQLQLISRSASRGTPAPGECRTRRGIITGDSIGALRVGNSTAQVLAECPHPVIGWDWGAEAIPEPALLVRVSGGAVLVTFSDTTAAARVVYLAVEDSVFSTPEGVRVGNSVTGVQAKLGLLEFIEGECTLYASTRARPRLGIQLTLPSGRADCGFLVPKPPALPRGSVVARLFVHY
jgi:hypothetical protein